MLTKDALKLKAFRAMSAAFTNELVAKNRKPQEFLKDEEAPNNAKTLSSNSKEGIARIWSKKKKPSSLFWKLTCQK